MSTELQPVEENNKLLRSAVADEAIAEFALKVADLDATTDEGYEEIKKAIRWCVKARSAVTGLKEEMNKAALAHQRAVNAEEKRLIGLVSEVESQLKAKKQAVDDEVDRKRKELEAKHEAWIVGRQDHFFAVTGDLLSRTLAEEMSEGDYEAMVAAGRVAKQKAALEAARIAQQEAEEKEAFRQAQAKLAAEKAEFERQQAEFKAAQELLARQQAEQTVWGSGLEGCKRAKLEAESGPLQPMVGTRPVEPMELDYYDDGGQIAHQSVDAPMSIQDAAQVEAITNFRIDQASASREEAELASVQDSGDVDEDKTVRKLIAPIHSEVMVRLVRMQNEAKALEAMFNDSESYLMEYESMAADIRLAVEALQEEMDKYEPKQ